MIATINSKSVNKEKIICYWRQNPVQAVKDIFDVDLDWHQRLTLTQTWFNDDQTNILSRGTGKTFLCGLCASLEGILKPSYRIGLIGPSFRQSKMIWAEVEKLYEKSPIFQQAVSKPPAITPEKCYLKFHAAPGHTSTVIEALPLGSDGSKIRGARYFSTYVDEAAQVLKSILDVVVRGFMATSANPMEKVRLIAEQDRLLAEGLITPDQIIHPPANKMVFSTTAYYQYNHAWERVSKLIERMQRGQKLAARNGGDASKYLLKGAALNEGQIPFRVLSDGKEGLCAFTCLDPSKGFMNLDSIKKAHLEMSDYQFKMEYMAYFPPDSEGFFRRSMLDKARSHNSFGPIMAPRKGCFYTMGADPARHHDNFSIAIYEIDPDEEMIRLVRIVSWNNKNYPEMHRNIRKFRALYGMTYFEMDAGGGGETIRDLLADPQSLPVGERLILEQGLDEHKVLTGDRFLGPLIQFSNYAWVQSANYNMLSALQHGRLQIAAQPLTGTTLWTPDQDDADEEMERGLSEMASVIVTNHGARQHWDTPTGTMRKDRYSAALIGFSAAERVLSMHNKPQKLAGGFWG